QQSAAARQGRGAVTGGGRWRDAAAGGAARRQGGAVRRQGGAVRRQGGRWRGATAGGAVRRQVARCGGRWRGATAGGAAHGRWRGATAGGAAGGEGGAAKRSPETDKPSTCDEKSTSTRRAHRNAVTTVLESVTGGI